MSFVYIVSKVEDELNKEGFGILTKIDVKDTLKKKLNVDFREYKRVSSTLLCAWAISLVESSLNGCVLPGRS